MGSARRPVSSKDRQSPPVPGMISPPFGTQLFDEERFLDSVGAVKRFFPLMFRVEQGDSVGISTLLACRGERVRPAGRALRILADPDRVEAGA
jgi:hypothetical protein